MWDDFVQGVPASKRYVTSSEFESFQRKMEETLLKSNRELIQQLSGTLLKSTQSHAGATSSANNESESRARAGSRVDSAEILDIEADSGDFDDEVSLCSGNFKRRRVPVHSDDGFGADEGSDVKPEDSVSNVGSSDGARQSSTVDSDYQEVISELISTLDLSEAVVKGSVAADIQSSRVKDSKSKIMLPLAQSHKDIIDRVWQRDATSVSVFTQSVTQRYHITEKDFESYCKVGAVDKILVHALRRNGVQTATGKSKSDVPKLPAGDNSKLEARAWRIERQSLAGLSCASVQSWLLQFMAKKLEVLDSYLKESFTSHYEEIVSSTGIDVLPKALLLSQDAALDQLDLWARAASNAKSQRRLLWLQPSPWPKQMKEHILRFPVEAGLVCGSKLLESLEEYKVFDEALDRVETPSTSHASKGGKRQNAKPFQPPPPPKRSRTDTQSQSADRGRSYGRGANRGIQQRSHSAGPYPGSSGRGTSRQQGQWPQAQEKKDYFPKAWGNKNAK
jgi:hypothetical protein